MMLLISPNRHIDESRDGDSAAGSHQKRWKTFSFAVAILLLGVLACPAPVLAQYGNGVVGAIIGQSMRPSPQDYQPPPPYSQYQPPPYQQSYDRYLQYEETEQLRQANGGAALAKKQAAVARARKRKAQSSVAAAPASAGVVTVTMKKTGGTFEVPVRLNNAVTIDSTVDSGAADVMIPANVVSALIKSGTLKQEDYIGGQTFTLADGSKLPSVRFKL
ncbi:MAG: hypothetical protein WB760_02040, partial [Xanthobacteraceae bacterium]